VLNYDTLAFELPVEFYTATDEGHLGKTLLIKGKLQPAKSLHRPNVLTGKIIRKNIRQDFPGKVFNGISSYINRLFKSLFSDDDYNLSTGLVLGGSSRVGDKLQDIFTRAGVLHILSVSGLHVGFVISFVGIILIFTPVSPKIKFAAIMLVLLVYAGITGFRPCVLRAVLMACLFSAALVMQRNVDATHILNISALILLIIGPMMLFDIGAQLSFASVYGILYLYPKIQSVIAGRVASNWLKAIFSLMAVSFSAQVFVSPLLIQYFHRTQTLAVFSNLLVVPLTSIITYLLFICIIVSPFFLPLAKVAAFLTSALLALLRAISRFFAAIPFSSISLTIPPVISLIFFMLFFNRLRKPAVYLLLASAIIFSAAAFSPCVMIKVAKKCSWILLPGGQNVMIAPKPGSEIVNELESNTVDYLIAPENSCAAATSHFTLPEKLNYKVIELGNIMIELNHEINIVYNRQTVNIDQYRARKNVLTYILTNGIRKYEFTAPLYNSLVDQLVIDLKILFIKLRLMFCPVSLETG